MGEAVMRCVVFDPSDMEALTVIEVPQSYIRELERGSGASILRFAIDPLPVTVAYGDPQLVLHEPIPVAEVRLEPFQYRRVRTWCALALNPEICLLMRSELLPGQRREARERERTSFVDGFARGISAAFQGWDD